MKDANVILIGIDTLRADHLGCHGYPNQTSPVIDAFAKRGIFFKNCFSQAPVTPVSFMSILTSLYPTYHGLNGPMGMLGAYGRAYALDPAIPTLPEVLKQHGYQTAAFTDGGQLYEKLGFSKGFDYYDRNDTCHFGINLTKHQPGGSIPADEIFYWLQEFRNKKFFLFLHTYAVHNPWKAPTSYWDLFSRGYQGRLNLSRLMNDPEAAKFDGERLYHYFYEKVNRDDPADVAYAQALYDGAIKYVDDFFGKLINYLNDLHLSDNTIVIFTSDHGEEFLEHGSFGHVQFYNELLHVPLIIAAPGIKPSVVEQTVRSIDIFPTVLDILKIPADRPIHGASLIPTLSRKLNMTALAETEWGYSVRTEALKYIYPQYKHFRVRTDELYDVKQDPAEQNNIALDDLEKVEELMHAYNQELHRLPLKLPKKKLLYLAKLQSDARPFREVFNPDKKRGFFSW